MSEEKHEKNHEDKYIFGVHILESLTLGMYQDSRTIFREYIQNACDSIDDAVMSDLIEPDECIIDIKIDTERRNITITDNAMGIKATEFQRVMGNIADSDKRIGEDRGFRGIGRLCGLAYCEKVIFTAKYHGEGIISRLVCNAGILRSLLDDRNSGVNRYTASEVLYEVNEFFADSTDETESHYFKVELININPENTSLLDYEKVKNYLSLTAPLPYSLTFQPFSSDICKYAIKINHSIDEYNIFLNDDQLFKEYTTGFKTGRGNSKGYDEIFDIKFEEFRDINNNLIAWLWFGISKFKGAIEEKCLMRGIRMRKGNIQIGDENTLRRFFTESRGNSYFIGELFCISNELIPNSQRDYFSETPLRVELEKQIRNYFRELTKHYHDGSAINSAYTKCESAEKKRAELNERINCGKISDIEERKHAREELRAAEEEFVSARRELDKFSLSGSSIAKSIIERIEKHKTEKTSLTITQLPASVIPKYTQRESRLIRKIFDVIRSSLNKGTADMLIMKIEDSLK